MGSLQQMAFASQKVLWSVPQTVLYIDLTVSCCFLGKWLLLEKVLWRVPPSILYICLPKGCCFIKARWNASPSLLLGSKLPELWTRLTHTNPVRRKRPIMSLLLGYSLGLFPQKCWVYNAQTFVESFLWPDSSGLLGEVTWADMVTP